MPSMRLILPSCEHQDGASEMAQSSHGDRQPPGYDGGEELPYSWVTYYLPPHKLVKKNLTGIRVSVE